MTYTQLREALEEQGFLPYRPTATTVPDGHITATMMCGDCGTVGLELVPFHHRSVRPSRGGYIAVAQCLHCGWATEF